MGKGEGAAQRWLPGFEPWVDPASGRSRLERRSPRRAAPRPPTLDKLLSGTASRVKKLFAPLRAQLLAETGIAEAVAYDDVAGAFAPAYSLGRRELLRLHLDPVLAATMTLERGDRELGEILASPRLSERLKAHTLRCARRSGRRVFLALLVRNGDEMKELVSLVRERVSIDAS